MSVLVKIPVANVGITMNEVPDKIAVYFEIGECQQNCKGCHSPHLHKKTDHLAIEDMEALAENAIDAGANAIVLMGGTTNGIAREHLKMLINNLGGIAPVCLYSGSDDLEADLELALETNLTWLKTGSYKKELGGLLNPKTNQRFFRKDYFMSSVNYTDIKCLPEMIDMTDFFRRKIKAYD